jgi:hypothetical protein
MYSYVLGGDEHFCFKRHKTRKEAELWLKDELFLYNICYSNADSGVLPDKEFFQKFPDGAYVGKLSWRRLGNALLDRVRENSRE